MSATDNWEERLAQAAEQLEQGQNARAISTLQLDDQQFDDDGRAWRIRGMAHFGLHNYEAAESALEHASLLIPLEPFAQCRLAECYLRARRHEPAAAIYEYLSTRSGLCGAVVEIVARGLIRVRKEQLAATFGLSAFTQNDDSPELSDAMRRLNFRNDRVLPYADRAYRLQPENLSYRVSYTRHLVAEKRHSDAVAIVSDIDIDRVRNIPLLYQLQSLFKQLGQTESVEHCAARLKQRGYEISSSWRPPKGSI